VNRTSKQAVQEVALSRFAAPLRGAATMPLGLCRDQLAGRIYVLAGDDALEVDATAEERDMWRAHLERGDYAAALLHCRTAAQRNAVYLAEAAALFEDGDYVAAAALYGKVPGVGGDYGRGWVSVSCRLCDVWVWVCALRSHSGCWKKPVGHVIQLQSAAHHRSHYAWIDTFPSRLSQPMSLPYHGPCASRPLSLTHPCPQPQACTLIHTSSHHTHLREHKPL
jgi:hypothetical protein